MSKVEMETRIAALETEIALLKEKFEKIEKDGESRKNGKSKTAWWEARIGIFADDPAHEEAMRLGREYRLAQREDYDKDED